MPDPQDLTWLTDWVARQRGQAPAEPGIDPWAGDEPDPPERKRPLSRPSEPDVASKAGRDAEPSAPQTPGPAEADPRLAELRDRMAHVSGRAESEPPQQRRSGRPKPEARRRSAEHDSEVAADRGQRGQRQQPAEDPAARAHDICLQLLTVRPRTRSELKQALRRKGIAAEVAEQVLGRLDDVGLIDDKAFAEMWVRSRHTYQGMGRRALSVELRRRGVDNETAAEAVAAVDSEAEEVRARQLVRKRLPSMSSADEQTKIRRLVGMLARKGYSEGLSYRVVKDELANIGEETTLLDPGFSL